jgi:ADP-heptose:LPS heptosyltransferase
LTIESTADLHRHGWQRHRHGTTLIWLAPHLDQEQWQTWLLERLAIDKREPGGQLIQASRNVISRQQVLGLDICLKDFGLQHIQALIYGLRSSKARRGAGAALCLRAAGFDTPEPLAVLEQYRCGLLRRSMLICSYLANTCTLRQALTEHADQFRDRLPFIGSLVATMHDKNLYHADLTAGNLLLHPTQNQRCWLVDVNRLRRQTLTKSARLDNLAQLGLPPDAWTLLLQGYAPTADAAWREAAETRLRRAAEQLRQRGLHKRQRRQLKHARRSACARHQPSTSPTMSTSGPVWLIRAGAMGDMVMMTAVARALAERNGAPVHLVTSGPWSPPLLQRCPAVADWYLLGSMKTPYWCNPAKWRAVHAVRRSLPSELYVFGGDKPSWSLARRCGLAPERLHWISRQKRQDNEHVLAAMLRLVGATADTLPWLEISAQDHNDASAWMMRHGLQTGRFVLIQSGNKKTMRRADRQRTSNTKHWPEERWQAVLTALLKADPERRVVLCGTTAEAELNEHIGRALPAGRWLSAAGDLPIGRLLSLAKQAQAMISVDTGPAHAAAAVGCPCLVLFGRTDPRKYLPRGPAPCLPVHALDDHVAGDADWWAAHHAMHDITVDLVLERWHLLLERMPHHADR